MNIKKLKDLFYIKDNVDIIDNKIVKTNSVINCLNSLIFNIKNNIPTLLIGETGTGKTTMIEYLCNYAKELFHI
ncbi:hypothetical protein A0H76_2533 [Hepatospora eriocheir]|nr:hypothetical protein A0H76_2533 [Hepatospora eriocheir]